jgi:spore coat-associated protein N
MLRSLSRAHKIVLSFAAVSAAASIAGLGTFATFTGSTSASHELATGTVAIALGAAGTADNRLTIGAAGMVPGDTLQRRVKLSNAAGNENLASIVLTTSANPSSVLDTDATNGLRMKIDKCSGTWKESLTTPYAYTCDQIPGSGDNLGTRTAVLAERAIIGSNLSLSGMSAVTAGNTDDMLVTISLPSSADNTFQNKTSTVTYLFTGMQRNGAGK